MSTHAQPPKCMQMHVNKHAWMNTYACAEMNIYGCAYIGQIYPDIYRCIDLQLYACVSTNTHTQSIHKPVHICTQIQIHIYSLTHSHKYTCVAVHNENENAHAHMHTSVSSYAGTCKHANTHVKTCIYTHMNSNACPHRHIPHPYTFKMHTHWQMHAYKLTKEYAHGHTHAYINADTCMYIYT